MSHHVSRFLGALFAFALSSASLAQTNAYPSFEYRDRIKVDQTIQPLGDNPFGENVNLYKGGLTFTQTDISYPGIGPTITLARTYEVGVGLVRSQIQNDMADWSLSVPRISTIVPGEPGSPLDGFHCTNFGPVSPAPYIPIGRWWNGYHLRTPDGGSQPLMKRAAENTNAPSSGQSYGVVTPNNWVLRCTTTPASAPGEGFVALAPDGTEYTFDLLVAGRAIETLTKELQPDYEGHVNTVFFPRKEAHLYLTQIKDRFNNTLTYTYNGARLTGITASDGRAVSIAWNSEGVVSSITVQPSSSKAQTWTYEYSCQPTPCSKKLSRVVLPHAGTDSAPPAWTFAMADTNALQPDPEEPAECGYRSRIPWSRDFSGFYYLATARITHPSGLIGDFDVAAFFPTQASVPLACDYYGTYENLPTGYTTFSLSEKRFSGPGLTSQKWTYRMAPGQMSSASECPPATCQTKSLVEVTGPDNSTTRYEFRSVWDDQEGKLLKVTYGISSPGQATPTGLRTETFTYAPSTHGTGRDYPSHLGDNLDGQYDTINEGPIEKLSPQATDTITQQGVTFKRTNSNFDAYGNVQKVVRASTNGSGGNSSRTENVTFNDNLLLWVIGQPATVKVGTTLVSEILYDSALALPTTKKSFGLVQQTLAYNSDGTLASVTDPGGHSTTLTQWKIGVPQRIDFPTGTHISAFVDGLGHISNTTDELSNFTSYTYDAAGRLKSITYPTGDAVTWNGLSRSFSQVNVFEQGLPPGHWKEVVATGTGTTTTYYDARWLPVLIQTEDTTNAASRSFVVQRFDGMGRPSFKSYPVATANVTDPVKGVTTSYDLLGRIASVQQDSEQGPLSTVSTYLSGFRTQVVNPRGNATITSYQVFDTPATDAPVLIQAPEGQTTTITRDTFGAPLTITRSGPAN
jgi:YD repeat-containing protein